MTDKRWTENTSPTIALAKTFNNRRNKSFFNIFFKNNLRILLF
jgi:hypothetical protein